MNATLKVIFERRSCRSFDATKKVSEDDLYTVLKAGAYAPSAMNSQAWHFTAVTSAEKLEKLNEAVRSSLPQPDIERISSRSADKKFNFFYSAPVLIIVSCSDKSIEPTSDCACALQNMFLAATSLGLGTCWINQLTHNCDKPAVRETLDSLGVPPQNKVYGCCALGHPAGLSPLKDRAPGVVNIVK